MIKMSKYKYVDEGKKHLHTFNEQPLYGTTSVLGVVAKNLTWWSAELSAVECLEAGEKIPTIRVEYLEAKKIGKEGIDALQKKYPIFKKARFAHMNDRDTKADKGTDMHEIMELHVKSCIKGDVPVVNKEDKAQMAFDKWAKLNVKRFLFSEGFCYSEKSWLGGICDGMYESKDGHYGIIDFKSSKEAYLSHYLQCALYDIQISENGVFDKDGNSVYRLEYPIEFYTIFPFGAEKPEPFTRWDVEALKVGALGALELYKLENNLIFGKK